jgi:hypothetical protein
MDGLLGDYRFWITFAGGIISALIAKLVSYYDKYLNILFEQDRNHNEDFEKVRKEISNIHEMISEHLSYHKGLKNRDNE